MTWYLKSTKHAKLRFKIVELNKETKQAKLLGDTGVPFSVQLTKENLEKYGWEVTKGEPS